MTVLFLPKGQLLDQYDSDRDLQEFVQDMVADYGHRVRNFRDIRATLRWDKHEYIQKTSDYFCALMKDADGNYVAMSFGLRVRGRGMFDGLPKPILQGGWWYLYGVWVKPGHRGKGTLARLLDSIRAHLRTPNGLLVSIHADNAASKRGFTKYGFRKASRWPAPPYAGNSWYKLQFQ